MLVRFLTFGHSELKIPIHFWPKLTLLGLHSYFNLKKCKKFDFTSSRGSKKICRGPLIPYLDTTFHFSKRAHLTFWLFTFLKSLDHI